ncbi:MAG: Uma2 family endonuclease [Acidimicrobiia bacterium]|nr:Uma2 family endonuclease [Chloroflexota bacterium]MYB24299.1 Uma2 family endonuclease [Acidimicrobiia bacterium]
MTTANTSSKIPRAPGRFRLPDIPDREPDEVTQYDQLFHRGLSNSLRVHLGNYDTTLVGADHWIAPDADFDRRRARYPDLLVAFGVDPEAYRASNGYVVSEQGKAPDFVLEVASESTGENDVGDKRDYYESLGILEYWRFDETGEHHGAKLAGDVLVEGRYEAIEIRELPSGVLQGYSRALNLDLRWEAGRLVMHDPSTGRPIPTLEDERQARLREREGRVHAEARNRELEEELRRLQGSG